MSKVATLALLLSLIALAISGYIFFFDIVDGIPVGQNGTPKASRQVVLGLTNDWNVGKVIHLEEQTYFW